MLRTHALLATLVAAALCCGEASACQSQRVVTPYWTSAPPDLAADEAVIEVQYLGDPTQSPSTMSTSILPFRVVRTVSGAPQLPKDVTLHVMFEARCRILSVQASADRPLLLVGKLVTRWPTPLHLPAPLIEPRYRDCTREHAAESDGNTVWVCPLSPDIPALEPPPN